MPSLGVFLGRFQPFHLGHEAVLREAVDKFDKVLVVIGSSGKPRSLRNPFTAHERSQWIREIFPTVDILALRDSLYNDEIWASTLLNFVDENYSGYKVHLLGSDKDSSTWYLKLFSPPWQFSPASSLTKLNATDIRNEYFSKGKLGNLNPVVKNWLESSKESQFIDKLTQEYEDVTNFKKQQDSILSRRYGSTFVTTDAVVTCGPYILLVQRVNKSGLVFWSLPGGFLSKDLSVQDSMLQSLKEKTNIELTERVLKNCIVSQRMFDDVYRSDRGRLVTCAHHIKLELPLPKVRGEDEGSRAEWKNLRELCSSGLEMFEDHLDIIGEFVNLSIPLIYFKSFSKEVRS